MKTFTILAVEKSFSYMKKLLLLFSFFIFQFSIFTCYAQNLIPNGDFELGPDSSSGGWFYGIDSTCTAVGTVYGPDCWSVANGSPDRLVEGDIPTCNWDNDTAYSGKAYVVFGWNEAGKTILVSSLDKDSIYQLKYCAKLETFNNYFEPTRIKFYFNNGYDSILSPFINYSSQWQCYDTIFKATSIISEIEIWGIEFVSSAVKIDNLYLEKISSIGINENYLEMNLKIYPNPTNDYVVIENMLCENNYSIKIYNLFNELI
ncbi:MAG: hypothetical protein V1904_06185, partial [Bacteroidota bacterium]